MKGTIKRELEVDNDLYNYLLDNMEFAAEIYNTCIDIVRDMKIKDNKTTIDYQSLQDIIKNDTIMRNINFDDKSYYCRGICDYVCYELNKYLTDIKYNDENFDINKLKYRKCNKYRANFTFGNYKYTLSDNTVDYTISEIDKNYIIIRVNAFKKITLYIKESSWFFEKEKIKPTTQNISNIGIVYKNNKFFIYLNIK